jgi:hypothetical protein
MQLVLPTQKMEHHLPLCTGHLALCIPLEITSIRFLTHDQLGLGQSGMYESVRQLERRVE